MVLKRKTYLKRKCGIKKKSSALSKIESEMHKMYDIKAEQEEHICAGCGRGGNVSHSHIISRKDHDLMADPRNVAYHCLPIWGYRGCSWLWEQNGKRLNLLDYIKNMGYVKEVRPQIFRSMIVGDFTYCENNPDFTCSSDNFLYMCKEYRNLK